MAPVLFSLFPPPPTFISLNVLSEGPRRGCAWKAARLRGSASCQKRTSAWTSEARPRRNNWQGEGRGGGRRKAEKARPVSLHSQDGIFTASASEVMPSVVVNVAKYERANYGTLGDLLTTITTSHQHIIMMEIVIPRELQRYPVTSAAAAAACVRARGDGLPCLVTGGDKRRL